MKRVLLFFGAVVALCFIGCKGEEDDDLITQLDAEREIIRDYLNHFSKSSVIGIPYYNQYNELIDSIFIFNNELPGIIMDSTGYVMYDYTSETLDGTLLESTDASLEFEDGQYPLGGPIFHKIDTANFNYFRDAFANMAEESTGEMIIPFILLDHKTRSTEHYKIRVHKYISDLFVFEKEMILEYLADIPEERRFEGYGNGDTLTYPILTVAGSGLNQIKEQDTISVSIQTIILNQIHVGVSQLYGVRDTIASKVLTLDGKFQNREIAEALLNYKEGDSGEIIVPFFNRGGTTDVLSGSKIIFPAFTTLLHSIKITEVKEYIKPEPEPENPEPENPVP